MSKKLQIGYSCSFMFEGYEWHGMIFNKEVVGWKKATEDKPEGIYITVGSISPSSDWELISKEKNLGNEIVVSQQSILNTNNNIM